MPVCVPHGPPHLQNRFLPLFMGSHMALPTSPLAGLLSLLGLPPNWKWASGNVSMMWSSENHAFDGSSYLIGAGGDNNPFLNGRGPQCWLLGSKSDASLTWNILSHYQTKTFDFKSSNFVVKCKKLWFLNKKNYSILKIVRWTIFIKRFLVFCVIEDQKGFELFRR